MDYKRISVSQTRNPEFLPKAFNMYPQKKAIIHKKPKEQNNFAQLPQKSYRVIRKTLKSPEIYNNRPNQDLSTSPSNLYFRGRQFYHQKENKNRRHVTNLLKSVDTQTRVRELPRDRMERVRIIRSPSPQIISRTTTATLASKTTPFSSAQISKYKKDQFYSRNRNIENRSHIREVIPNKIPQQKVIVSNPIRANHVSIQRGKTITRSVPRSPVLSRSKSREIVIYKRDQSTGKLVKGESRTMTISNAHNHPNNIQESKSFGSSKKGIVLGKSLVNRKK